MVDRIKKYHGKIQCVYMCILYRILILCSYAGLLKKAKGLGIKKEVISGFGTGINLTILFSIAALAYW